MPTLTYSPLITLTDAAATALQNAIASQDNTIWNGYRATYPNDIITPLVGGGPGIPIPANNGGVYIWGYWIECDQTRYFVPIALGSTIQNCIDYILTNLLNPTGGTGAFVTMAQFQIANCTNANQLYNCLMQYNVNNLNNSTAATIAANMAAFFATPNAQWLRFFHNREFYVNKIPTCAGCYPAIGGYHGISDDGQQQALCKLRNTPPGCIVANKLADEINLSREYLASHFCFTYMDLDTAIETIEPGHPLHGLPPLTVRTKSMLLNRFKKATKIALENIDLYTMSLAVGPLVSPINVDLSNIQNNLINITGAAYPYPLDIAV